MTATTTAAEKADKAEKAKTAKVAKEATTPSTAASAPAPPKNPPSMVEERNAHAGFPIDSFSRRSRADVMTGLFCKVVKGKYAGRYGVYDYNATVAKDGYPLTVIVKTRDENHEYITVNYSDIEPSEAGHR